MNKFVVIDLETTGHSPSDKIIEVGMVMIKEDKIVDKKTTLLNPGREIPPFISNLTNITDEDVEDAPSFSEKADPIVKYFQDSYLIAHNVPFDMGFLNTELKNSGKTPLNNPVIDTVELSRILIPNAPSYKLSQLANHLNIEHDDPHRALSDAYVTAKLFLLLKDKLFRLPYETLIHLARLEQFLDSNLHDLLQEAIDKASFTFSEEEHLTTYNGLAFNTQDINQENNNEFITSYGDYLDAIYEENGSLENQFTEYEKRTGQRDMSEVIYDAFQSKKHALIEAQTGTGKSLAYLLPAVYEAFQNKEQIVISTYTTQLQAQLLEEEIPLIKDIIPFPIEAVVLKGRTHYLSLERFSKELQYLDKDNYDVTLTKAIILVWITETTTGDIDEIRLPTSGYAFFNRVSAGAEDSRDFHSPWFQYSFYTQAKRRAERADLIITNHALLCTDIFNEYQFLPRYDKLIIDEAHHLETTAAHHYGLKLDNISMAYTLNQIGKSEDDKLFNQMTRNYQKFLNEFPFDKWDEVMDDAKYEMDEFFQYLYAFVNKKRKNNRTLSDIGRIQYRFGSDEIEASNWNIITEMVNRVLLHFHDMIQYLSTIHTILEEKEEFHKHDKQELNFMIDKLQGYIDDLQHLFITDLDTYHVQWIEIGTKGYQQSVYLYSEPTDISTLLKKELFDQKDSVILTSATLTMRNSFHYIRDRLGLSEDGLITKQIHSPFSFDKQVQVLVPNDFPNIKYDKMDDYVYATSEAILSLAEITNGRMLVLFTSYDMLRKSYKLLKEIMEDDKYMLIGQGITSGSRARLKKNFQSFRRSILLGTSSFWEGVDIPGEDLSCVMIVRLPFEPPNHPVFEAKAKEMKQNGKNPFMELSLPNAVIKFKQGFGRLIRSTNDRGIIFICDARVIQARYGKYFTESIPEVPFTYGSTQDLMERAEEWF